MSIEDEIAFLDLLGRGGHIASYESDFVGDTWADMLESLDDCIAHERDGFFNDPPSRRGLYAWAHVGYRLLRAEIQRDIDRGLLHEDGVITERTNP